MSLGDDGFGDPAPMDDDTDRSEMRAGSEVPSMSLFDAGETPRPSTSNIRESSDILLNSL